MASFRARRWHTVLVFVLVSLLSANAPVLPAGAVDPDPGIPELGELLGELAQWSSGLAEVGKLAEPIPTVGRSAGSVLGFPDLVQKTLADRLAGVKTWNELKGGSFGIDLLDGRSGTLATALTEAAGVRTLDLDLQVERTLADEPFSFTSATPPLTLTSAAGMSVKAEARFRLSVVVEPNGAGWSAYVVAGAGTPSLTVDVTADLPSSMNAAVGILGITITETVATPGVADAAIRFDGSVRDPDGDGRLYFVRPDLTPGELADPASLADLFSVGLRPTEPGHVEMDLRLRAAATTQMSLPAVDARFRISWPDIAVGTPDVTVTGLGPVLDFTVLSPRDLADLLGQLVTMVAGAQQDPLGNLELPFLSGTLADAIRGAEALAAFLEDSVVQPPEPGQESTVDPVRVGEPTFVSIQELVEQLRTYTGSTQTGPVTIGVQVDDYDPATRRLPVELTLSRTASGPIDLAPTPTISGASATYTPTTLTDTARTFAPELVGSRVIAGSAGGTIKEVSGSTLTLVAPWTPATPSGVGYVVGGPEADAGAVSLANELTSDGKGIRNANAFVPTARVTPRYTAKLRFALDLQPSREADDCNGPADLTQDPPVLATACPYERTNPDGTKLVVTQEPLPVERLLIGTGYDLLTADFPIEAGADIFANAGFLEVRVGAAIKVCRAAAGADCSDPLTGSDPMVRLRLEARPSDPADGYVPVADLFASLLAPAPVEGGEPLPPRVSFTTKIRAHATGQVTVPDSDQFLPQGVDARFTGTWPDITQGSPSFDVQGLSRILAFDFDPENPQALLGILLRVLQLVDQQMRAEGKPGLLAAKIPLVDRSLGDFLGADESGGGLTVTYAETGDGETARTVLKDTSRTGERAFPEALVGRSIIVGTQVALVRERPDGQTLHLTRLAARPANGTAYLMRSELADAISLLTAAPPDSLQQLVRILDERLGGENVRFRYHQIGDQPHLLIDMGWDRTYSGETPLILDLGENTIAGATGTGSAKYRVAAELDLDLAVPLVNPASLDAVPLKVLDSSRVAVDASADVAGSISASLGPLSLALGHPTDTAKQATASAHYSLAFAKTSPTGAAMDLLGFLGAVGPTVNGYAGGVDCGAAMGTGDALALCANLPMFTSTNGTTWTELLSPVKVRLPKAGADATQLFSLSGTVRGTDDLRLRLETPSPDDIVAAFEDAYLNFAMLGDGIDLFLALIETALLEASMEGKLPLAGSDLQAGSDFIGQVRTETRKLFDELRAVNGGRLPDVATVNTYLDTKFKKALADAGANPENFGLAITCQLPASDVTAVTGHGEKTGTTTYEYAVAAVGGLTGTDVATKPGAARTVSDRPDALDATDFNRITWSAVSNATKYHVLRRNAGGGWDLLETVTGTTTTFDDKGAAAEQTDYTPAERLATVDTCVGVKIQHIEGVVVRVDMGTGLVDAADGCKDKEATETTVAQPCLGRTIPLDIGIPGLALRASREDGAGGLQAKVGWRASLALELNRTDGLALLTNATGSPELGVGLSLDLAGTLQAELAILQVTATKVGTAPAFAAAFQVDLRAPGETPCWEGCTPDLSKRLTFADLQAISGVGDVLAAQLDLRLDVNWLLTASADSALPGVEARLVMAWAQVLNPAQEITAGQLTIAFQDVKIDAGAFLSSVLGPVVAEIQRITGPLQPVIDTLYAPIPVLSDLSRAVGGGDVTIVTLAKTFSTLADGPKLDFIDSVAGVIRFANNLPTAGNVKIPVGSFTLFGDRAFTTPATPDAGAGLIQPLPSEPPDLRPTIDGAIGGGRNALAGEGSETAKAGFKFPLLEKPSLLFNLLMNADVDIVTYDSGPLTLAFTWRQSFGPVYAPPPVMVTLSGTASVTARIQAGFDTYGLRKMYEEGASVTTGLGILNGLYLKSADSNGKPLPVVTFRGEIAAGAQVSAVIITVGIEGGVTLTIAFAWNDPNNDGKFRLFEFGRVALNNPICLFQMSGRIGVFLRLYITLGYKPFAVSFSLTVADVTLLDFSAKPNCDPKPPSLAGVVGGETLVVFAGAHGGAPRGDAAWHNTAGSYKEDVFKITQLHTYPEGGGTPTLRGLKVEALGMTEEFSGTGFKRVVVDGRGYGKPMKITMLGDGNRASTADVVPTAEFTLDAIVIGGSAADTIKTGTGRSLIDGGGGDDTITVSDLPAAGRVTWIAGGPGSDSIMTGDADAIVAGDSHLRGGAASYPTKSRTVTRLGVGTTTLTLVDWEALAAPAATEAASDGNDRIALGLGANQAFGNGGDDVVSVASDSELAKTRPAEAARWTAKPNTIVLGSGSDAAKGGSNDDTIWTGVRTSETRADGKVDEPGGADRATWSGGANTPATRNVVETGAGNDTVFGSLAPDHVTAGSTPSQVAHLRGGGGDDVLIGGHGADQLFGGPGQDWVVAEPATVGDRDGTDAFGVVRTYLKTPLPAGVAPSQKLLVGGDHEDRIIGGDGGAEIYGDRHEAVACGAHVPSGQPASTPPAEPTAGTPGRDHIRGGEGIDKVKAGGGADRIEGYGGDDLICGQGGDDVVFAGTGDDTVWGGSGGDVVYGDAGADRLFGNDDDDRLFGGAGDDIIEGNDGADTAFGGPGDDLILGGTRAAGVPDGGDTLYGEDGDDIVIGDNGSDTYPYDLDATNLAAGGADRIFGGLGDDRLFGGLHGDVIYGGDGDDRVEGNHGDDTIHGEAGEDRLVGGSSELAAAGVGRPDGTDTIHGGDGNDVIAGDNAILAVVGSGEQLGPFAGRGFALLHRVTLHDLGYEPTAGTSAGDIIRGGDGNDVIFGQGGDDEIDGDAGDDHIEGGPGADSIDGGDGDDDLVGGSSTPLDGQPGSGQPDAGDIIDGGDGHDVVLGDNGAIRRTGPMHPLTAGRGIPGRAISLLDLGDAPQPGSSGDDLVTGNAGNDVILGQGGNDRLKGDAGHDYLEGGPGDDWLEGGDGDDDLVGGSYTPLAGTAMTTSSNGGTPSGQPDGDDVLWGGAGDDVLAGDNAQVLRTGSRTKATDRLGTTTPGTRMAGRNVTLLDLRNPTAGSSFITPIPTIRYGADRIAGGAGVDVAWGQDGDDIMSGGPDDDHLEGNGGADRIRGDLSLLVTNDGFGALPDIADPGWPGTASPPSELEGTGGDPDGQDDIIGGSARAAFRDGDDRIQGDGGDDVVLGDNGTLVRTLEGSGSDLRETRYVERYRPGTPVGQMTKKRTRDPALAAPTTRFCNPGLPQCEPVGAFGDDVIHGGDGDDGLWGQDGDDTIRGGAGHDEIYGELGHDRLFGDAGDDTILGDRGGVRITYLTADDPAAAATLNSVPKESFALRRAGSRDRRVDLLHDTDGNAFLGGSTAPAMPHPGLLKGGDDLIRGGAGHDQIHAGAGHDVVNGDSGGDAIFGGDGADVIWGGKGCEPAAGECPIGADGKPNLAFRGPGDRYVDHLFGGRSGPTGVGILGADILDWAPRREAPCTDSRWPVTNPDGTTSDPCLWLEMTSTDDGDEATNQHHHGTDWIYGGWGRDIMQADVAGTGPNAGDRLIDWHGVYNLYSHCEADYGGFNDIRLPSPHMITFLERLAWGAGAGQARTDLTDNTTSAHREVAIASSRDPKEAATGSAFPGTPGHFDRPVACDP
jgi:Ca2+-binding RTX toxin-like protein